MRRKSEEGTILIRCQKCLHGAIIHQRYSGMRLCREHFQEDVQRKAREYLRQTGLFGRRARIMIELDGGRNSSALAYILKSTFLRRRDIDLQALVIEEEGGDKRALGRAVDVAEQLEVPLIRKSLKLPEGEALHLKASARRRDMLSLTARETDARIIATGQDLEDEALKIFLGYLQGECSGCAGKDEAHNWIKPLQRIPKREVRLYALTRGLGSDCLRAPSKKGREELAGRLLYEFDSRHPGTNYSLLRGWERQLGLMRQGPERGKAFK